MLGINEFWREELRMEGDKEILRKLSEEYSIIYEYGGEFNRVTFFSNGKVIYGPSRGLNLDEVYENLLRQTTVGPYNISYKLGDCLFDEYECETLKDVFDFIFFELECLFDYHSWYDIIQHIRCGRSLPQEEGPHWFERLYRR